MEILFDPAKSCCRAPSPYDCLLVLGQEGSVRTGKLRSLGSESSTFKKDESNLSLCGRRGLAWFWFHSKCC